MTQNTNSNYNPNNPNHNLNQTVSNSPTLAIKPRKQSVGKFLAISVAVVALGAGIFTGLSVTTKAMPGIDSSAAMSAIQKGDIDGFKQALIAKATEKANSISQEDFDKIKAGYENKTAIENALKNKDYEAFKTAVMSLANTDASEIGEGIAGPVGKKMGDKINDKIAKMSQITQAEFDKMAENYTRIEEYNSRLTEAVKSENKDTFVAVFKERQEYMKNNRPVLETSQDQSQNSSQSSVENNKRFGKMDKVNLTDEQIGQIYEKHLAEYKESGEINIGRGFGMMGPKGFGLEGFGGMGMPRGDKSMMSN
jgi:hypothetical protein